MLRDESARAMIVERAPPRTSKYPRAPGVDFADEDRQDADTLPGKPEYLDCLTDEGGNATRHNDLLILLFLLRVLMRSHERQTRPKAMEKKKKQEG